MQMEPCPARMFTHVLFYCEENIAFTTYLDLQFPCLKPLGPCIFPFGIPRFFALLAGHSRSALTILWTA